MLYMSPPDIAEFELRNYQTIKALVEKHDIPCEWRTLSGVHAYMSKSMFQIGLAGVEALKKANPALAQLVSVVTRESKDPSLQDLQIPTAAGAFVQANAASLWPYKLVSWILETLLAKNKPENASFNLQTKTTVTQLQNVNGSWIVHTPRGMIAAKQVLLTTNGYTSALLPEFSDLIVPVKGEVSSLLPPKSTRQIHASQRLNHSYVFVGHGRQNINQSDYLTQRPFDTAINSANGGELLFGGGRSEAANAGVGNSDDSTIDLPAASYLRRELNVVLDLNNNDSELKASYEWTGIMGYSRDSKPWVGELIEDVGLGGGKGLWLSAGFTGHGMPNACLSAKAVAEMMLGSTKEAVYLPQGYHISVQRASYARSLKEVHEVDAEGLLM